MYTAIFRFFTLLMFVLLPICADAAQIPADLDAGRVRTVRITSLAVGGIAGLGIGVATVRAPGLLYESGTPGPYWPVAIPTVVVQTGSLMGGMYLFSEWFMRHDLRWYWAIPAGVLGGLAVGAASGAITWFSMASLGCAFDAMSFGSLPDTYWARAGMATLAGGLWGGMGGVIPGAVMAPLVGWVVRF